MQLSFLPENFCTTDGVDERIIRLLTSRSFTSKMHCARESLAVLSSICTEIAIYTLSIPEFEWHSSNISCEKSQLISTYLILTHTEDV